MYYPDYNPTLHDVYLYGPGNTGYPIGLNPTCLIYGARADYNCLSVRSRSFNVPSGDISPPPGTPDSLLPNYYNIGYFLNGIISSTVLYQCIHYTANKTSATTPPEASARMPSTANWTGTTTAYPIGSLNFWNSTRTGLCSYGPFIGTYNEVPSNQITGSTSYYYSEFVETSPEIPPPMGLGNTFYAILPPDIGFIDLRDKNIGPTFSQPKMKIISVPYLYNEMLSRGKIPEIIKTDFSGNIVGEAYEVTAKIDTEDCFFWDGNDKVIPVKNMKYRLTEGYIHYEGYVTIGFEGTVFVWVGDSSGQFIFVKNNNIFFIGSAYSSTKINSMSYSIDCKTYIGSRVPLYNGFYARDIDKNHFWYPHNDGITLGTKINIERGKSKMEKVLNELNRIKERVSS